MTEPAFDQMNETDVRESLVRPFLERLGYKHGTDATIITEKTLRYERAFLGRKNDKKDPILQGRADYICDVISFGRWVVEVKAPSEALNQDVVEQAHTYAAHPEIGASLFLVTNGRFYRLFETGRLDRPAMEWQYQDQDDNMLRLFNVLSPEAIRQRAKRLLIDVDEPLGKDLASKLRIVGGEITYEQHYSDHPLLQTIPSDGLVLAVTGGQISRDGDLRIRGHVKVAKANPFVNPFDESSDGGSDSYDFHSATKYIADQPDRPTIFQNMTSRHAPLGKEIRIPGMPAFPLPYEVDSTTYTEAVAYVQGLVFTGTIKLDYEFRFSKFAPNV